MASFKHRQVHAAAPFKERRTKGRVVPFRPNMIADPVASPARALQETLAQRTAASLYITDPTERRLAQLRFIGTAALLWGGMSGVIAVLMIAAS